MERNTKIIGALFLIVAVLLLIMYFSVKKNDISKNVNVSKGTIEPRGNGNIEIIEFSDFQCPVCGKQEPVLKNILNNYGDKVKIYYRHFPLSIHENSFNAALASMCANEQDRFWQYHDLLFENQNSLDKNNLKEYAETIGLNSNQFNTCLDSEKFKEEVNKDFDEGKKAGVKGTPTFFINGKREEGLRSIEFFENIIKNE